MLGRDAAAIRARVGAGDEGPATDDPVKRLGAAILASLDEVEDADFSAGIGYADGKEVRLDTILGSAALAIFRDIMQPIARAGAGR